MEPINVRMGTHIDHGVEHNEKDLTFKVGDHVRISKYKKKSQKATIQIGLKKVL